MQDIITEYVLWKVNYYFLSVIGVSFIAGIFLILLILKRKPTLRRELWTKYIVYLAIVGVSSILLLSPWRIWFLVAISGIGLVELFYSRRGKPDTNAFAYGYLLYCLLCSGMLIFSSMTNYELFWLYALIVLFDGFSQLAGLLFGREKLAPNISPNKTIEGFSGGVFAVFVALSFRDISNHEANWLLHLIITVLISIVGLIGDLLASKWKRMAGVKDFSNLLPAHGGILDRFDSFIGASGILGLIAGVIEFFMK
jgi:phosphatidate cytidylyltransferase